MLSETKETTFNFKHAISLTLSEQIAKKTSLVVLVAGKQ